VKVKITIIIVVIGLNMLLVGYVVGYYIGNKINIDTVVNNVIKQNEQQELLDARVSNIENKVEYSEIDMVVNKIIKEAIYSKYVLQKADAYLPEGHLLSLGALNYVQGNVSAPLYGYMSEIIKEAMSGFTPEEILKYRAGICGSSYIVFSAIIDKLGLPVRSVSFFWENGNNHIAAEVYYDGDWHFYDPTWGSYFVKDGDILSTEEAFQTTELEEYMITNESLLWTRVISSYYNNPGLRAFIDGGVTYKYGTEY